MATHDGDEQQISSLARATLAETFAVDVPNVVRHVDEIREVLASNPLSEIATVG